MSVWVQLEDDERAWMEMTNTERITANRDGVTFHRIRDGRIGFRVTHRMRPGLLHRVVLGDSFRMAPRPDEAWVE